MSPRMAKTHVAVILACVCSVVIADPGLLPACPPAPSTVTEQSAAYYSMIGQELAYAKIRENQALAAAATSSLLPGSAANSPLLACPPAPATLSSPKSNPSPAPRTSQPADRRSRSQSKRRITPNGSIGSDPADLRPGF